MRSSEILEVLEERETSVGKWGPLRDEALVDFLARALVLVSGDEIKSGIYGAARNAILNRVQHPEWTNVLHLREGQYAYSVANKLTYYFIPTVSDIDALLALVGLPLDREGS